MADKKLSDFLPARTPLSTDLVPTLRSTDPAATANDISTIQQMLDLLDGLAMTTGVDLTFSNPITSSSNSTFRPAVSLHATFDSTTVDPLFANQTVFSAELTALNGQNQYGGGTNAKESFFNLQNEQFAYASGQHFSISNSIYAFGMGDVFSESHQLRVMGGVSANGDEGTGYWTTLFQHYGTTITTSIVSVVTPATISTTLTQAVNKNKDEQTVTVASVVGVSVGQWIVVDPFDGSNIEAVKVTGVGAGTITGIFRSNHDNGDSIRPATVLTIDSGYGFGQGRPVINLTASAYTTGTATPVADSQAVTGAGTSWSSTMVGGDTNIPGYISFTEDDIDLTPYGSATTLKGWYPIQGVGGPTDLTLSRLDVLGEAGFPANSNVAGASVYTIRPGARLLMFDGGTSTIVLQSNAFTWTAGDSIECAFSVNNCWNGILMRFIPLMPGRYETGIMIENDGEFTMDTGLRVNANGNGFWEIGAQLSSSQIALSLSGSEKAIDIHVGASESGDIHWTASGYGISLGRNIYYAPGGIDGFIISTKANDLAGGYDAHESGVEAQDGVLSLAYNSTTSMLRWNGNMTLDGEGALIFASDDAALEASGAIRFTGGSNFVLNSTESVYINIDSDNDQTNRRFAVQTNTVGSSGGTQLFSILEDGTTAVLGNLDAASYSAGGTAGVVSFGPSVVTSITVKNGLVVNIS